MTTPLPLVRPATLTLACADLDARPLFWTDADRTRHGYEPDAAAVVARHMGLALEWRFLRWADFAPALARCEVDAIWCGSAITPARREVFDYSRPYAVFDEAVLVRRGDRARAPEDLAGRRVGAITGSTNMALAERWPDCIRVGFDGTSDDVFAEMINALRSGEIDAVVDDEPAFGGVVERGEFAVAFVVPTQLAWGAALRLGSETLRQALDAAIVAGIRSGELEGVWRQSLPQLPFPLSLA